MTTNWNEYSDDSWIDSASSSDDEQPKKPAVLQQPQHPQDEPKKQPAPKQEQSVQSATKKEEKSQALVEDSQKVRPERRANKQKSFKFPSDEQLLQEFESGKIQENKKLKVINCTEKHEQQAIKQKDSNKQLRVKEYRPNCFVITFWKKEDLVKFIREKIQKTYKFKIGIYVPSEKQKQSRALRQKQREKEREKAKQERQKQRNRDGPKLEYREKHAEGKKQKKQSRQIPEAKQTDQKQYRRQKDEKSGEKERRPKNEANNKPKEREAKHQQQKQVRDQRQEKKKEQPTQERRDTKPGNNLERNGKTSKFRVISADSTPADVVKYLMDEKINKSFGKITFKAAPGLIQYMEKVCQEIEKSIGFGLTSDIDEEKISGEDVEFVLQQKQKSKPIKRVVNAAYIESTELEASDIFEAFNVQIIGCKNNPEKELEKFDEQKYIELFKKNYPKIVGKWQNFVVIAYNSNISKLLKISGSIKKSLPKNTFNYEIGLKNDCPYAKFEILDLYKTKAKPDFSVVNHHLQSC